MAKTWVTVAGTNKTAWGIPPAEISELGDLRSDAADALEKAMSTDRTPTITARCKAAFEALVAKMRFFKSHYFLQPPLTDADLISLGLKPKDKTRTDIPAPVDLPGLEITNWAPHTLGFRHFVATDLLQLPTAASGMTCYLAACFENDKGQSGKFGPMIQAVVP
jgi:hypothetical protein